MSTWQKILINIIVSICENLLFPCLRYSLISNDETVSTLGLALVSGFGGLLGFYIPEYAAAGKGYADITHLMTYPSLFM
jgi:hypothetical protein